MFSMFKQRRDIFIWKKTADSSPTHTVRVCWEELQLSPPAALRLHSKGDWGHWVQMDQRLHCWGCCTELWPQGGWFLLWWYCLNQQVGTRGEGSHQADEWVLSDLVSLWDFWDVGEVDLGRGKRLSDCLKVSLATHQVTQEGKGVLCHCPLQA